MGVLAHTIEHRGEPSRVSAEKCSPTNGTLPNIHTNNVLQLIPVKHCAILHGVEYLRVAVDLINLTIPVQASDNWKAGKVAEGTEIPFGTVERILAYKREAVKSIKTDYMVALLAFATINGRDVFTVRGVRPVHDFIFGGQL